MSKCHLLVAAYLQAHGISVSPSDTATLCRNIVIETLSNGEMRYSYDTYVGNFEEKKIEISLPAPKDFVWRTVKEYFKCLNKHYIYPYSEQDIQLWVERIAQPTPHQLLEVFTTKNGAIHPGMEKSWFDFYQKTQGDRIKEVWPAFWQQMSIGKFQSIENKLHSFLEKSNSKEAYLQALYTHGHSVLSQVYKTESLKKWMDINAIPDGLSISIHEPSNVVQLLPHEHRLSLKWNKTGPEFLNLYSSLTEEQADSVLKKYTKLEDYMIGKKFAPGILKMLLQHPALVSYLIGNSHPNVVEKAFSHTLAKHLEDNSIWDFGAYLYNQEKIEHLRDRIRIECDVLEFTQKSVRERVEIIQCYINDCTPEIKHGEVELFFPS